MKHLLFSLCAIACLIACNAVTAKKGPDTGKTTATGAQAAATPPRHKVTLPRDTLLPNGVFVKYIIHDSTFSVQTGCGKWARTWGDSLEMDVPAYLVPCYSWSSDQVVALEQGCGGNYCSHHYYFLIGSHSMYRRNNELAHDSRHNLIACLNDTGSLDIENIVTRRHALYHITDTMMCAEPIACLRSVIFAAGKLIVTLQATRNGRDKVVARTFPVPHRLYTN